jgi:lectin domain-containing protein
MTLIPTFVDFSANPPRTANASVRADGAGDAHGHWILDAGGAVWVDFAAGTPADEVTMKICALVSKAGSASGHAPLDILVNGQSVVSGWRIPGGGDLPQVMTFAVPGEWLRSGSNTLELRSAEDSHTMLWLYRVLLESVWDRDAAERALLTDHAAESAFTYDTYSRPAGASEWRSGPQLRFQIDEGQAAAPAELSWRGSDGSEAAISFAGEMTGFLGHVRTTGGAWLQLRGDLTERRDHLDGSAQRFQTEVHWGGAWHQSGDLSVFLDTGSGPVERIGWRDQRGNTASIGLTQDGAAFTGYAQRVNEGPIGYRGEIVGTPLRQESPGTSLRRRV